MTESNPQTVLIRPGLLADGLGGSARSGESVFVRDGVIAAVGPTEAVEKDVPPGTETVDLPGCCLTPGLIDGHTHLSLPGTGEEPTCPVYVDGRHTTTLRGSYDELSEAFRRLIDDYVQKKYAKKPVAAP